jgi:hypothetical protein
MKTGISNAVLFCFVAIGSGEVARAGMVVASLSTPTVTFTAGQTLSIELIADLPDPVLGYGLDIKFDQSKLVLNGFSQGPLWFPASGSEPDDVAGIAFPTPVDGSGVLLGTFSFTALVSSSDTLGLAYDSRNLAEGFPLPGGGFDPSNVPDEAPITPPPQVPEPATTVPLCLAFLGLAVRVCACSIGLRSTVRRLFHS